jgi:rhamnosyltransferase
LRADGLQIFVADNGGGRAALAPAIGERVTLLDLGANLGIGAAIKAVILAARAASATHIITFDQDSDPSPGMVGQLVAEFERQTGRGIKLGAVGPRFVDRRRDPPLVHPFIRLGVFGSGHRYCSNDQQLVEVDTLITSGCLTSMHVLDEVGGMNQDYFVDYTDIEWCFRATSKGFALQGVCAAQMTHELGHGESRSVFGLNLFEYSPVRRYYYARNTLAVSALRYVPFRWKVRLIVGLMLRCGTIPWAPRGRGSSLKSEGRMLLRGIWDGLRGVQGSLKPSAADGA